MLEIIKNLLGITTTDKDELIQILIDQAQDEVLDYTHNPKALEYLQTTIQKMVVYNYNRLGTEGLDSESYNSASYSYSGSYPESFYNSMKAYRKVQVVK